MKKARPFSSLVILMRVKLIRKRDRWLFWRGLEEEGLKSERLESEFLKGIFLV